MIELLLCKQILLQTLRILHVLTKLLQSITLKGRELIRINLGWLLKFKKLSRESASLFAPTTTYFPLAISRIGVKVAGNARIREE